MNNWIILAILAWISMWAWWFFHDKSTSFINPVIWATLVSFIAFIIWLIVIFSSKEISFDIIKTSINFKAIFFITLVWIFAYLIDFFTLKTFASWIDISLWFTIIITVSIIFSAILWIVFLKEDFNITKFFWIIIIIFWIYLILMKW